MNVRGKLYGTIGAKAKGFQAEVIAHAKALGS